VTHRYTLLVGGVVLSGHDEAAATAIAWAEDTVIALGSDADVRAISRGDSDVIDLGGATVVPLGEGTDAGWPTDAALAIGGRADLAIVAADPRGVDTADPRQLTAIALIRGGRVVAGELPGDAGQDHPPPTPGHSALRS
jgi:predicted amidohydrolase YtcJ